MTNTTTVSARVPSLDLLRGIVMVLMVLDHARYLLHTGAEANPENLATTTPTLFFTRWVTHFCAPAFIFLVGASAWLYREKNGISATVQFLWKRGLLMLLIEFTVIRSGWDQDFTRPVLEMLVAWAIGISMLFLAVAIQIRNTKVLLGLGAFILLTHNLLDELKAAPDALWGKIWMLLHQSGYFQVTTDWGVFVLYPVLPYLGLVLLGYGFGQLYGAYSAAIRRQYLLRLGFLCIALFLLLRTFNLYGDPNPWSPQPDAVFSLLSFLKTTKYPTSLLYCLMTIGPALLLLRATDDSMLRVWSPLITIGQTPMVFYIGHLYAVLLVGYIGGGPRSFSLTGVYAATFCACLILYLLCNYYRRYKVAHPEKKWLAYF